MDRFNAALATVQATLPHLQPAESQFIRAVAEHETNYGRGWKVSGVGSHNWGAITGRGPAGSFQHKDSRPDPRTGKIITYTTDFAAYHDDAEAARALAAMLLTPSVRRQLSMGTMLGAVAAQYRQGYFTTLKARGEDAVRSYFMSLALPLIGDKPGALPRLLSATKELTAFRDAPTARPPSDDDIRRVWDDIIGVPGTKVARFQRIMRTDQSPQPSPPPPQTGLPRQPVPGGQSPLLASAGAAAGQEYMLIPAAAARNPLHSGAVAYTATFHPQQGWTPWRVQKG